MRVICGNNKRTRFPTLPGDVDERFNSFMATQQVFILKPVIRETAETIVGSIFIQAAGTYYFRGIYGSSDNTNSMTLSAYTSSGTLLTSDTVTGGAQVREPSAGFDVDNNTWVIFKVTLSALRSTCVIQGLAVTDQED